MNLLREAIHRFLEPHEKLATLIASYGPDPLAAEVMVSFPGSDEHTAKIVIEFNSRAQAESAAALIVKLGLHEEGHTYTSTEKSMGEIDRKLTQLMEERDQELEAATPKVWAASLSRDARGGHDSEGPAIAHI